MLSDPSAARQFLLAEVEALEPLDFIAARPSHSPLHVVEVTRNEPHGLEVHIAGRPAMVRLVPAAFGCRRGSARGVVQGRHAVGDDSEGGEGKGPRTIAVKTLN